MNSWTYPIKGEHKRFPEPDQPASFDAEAHYFTKAKGGYSASGVLRSIALFIDGLPKADSVENISVYPEYRDGETVDRWGGMVTVYHDRPTS